MTVKNKKSVPFTKNDKDYQCLLKDLKSILSIGQDRDHKVVDNIKAEDYRQLVKQDAINKEDLGNKIIADFKMFLKKKGEHFSILGQQVPVKIDNKTHFIDLVLSHSGIPYVVLIGMLSGKLNSGDIGRMNMYINYYRRNKQYEHKKNTIGLIICQDADRGEVMYTLDGLEKKIFIAKYNVQLPSEDKIRKAIKG